jgi:hypothetical protein
MEECPMNAPVLNRVAQAIRSLGPYVLIELLLPGGTLFAVLLWLYRRTAAGSSRSIHVAKAAPSAVEFAVTATRLPVLAAA